MTDADDPKNEGSGKRRRVVLEWYHGAMLEAVTGGATIVDAATACGIARRTGQRWAERHAAELRQARSSLLDKALGGFCAALPCALRTLRELAEDPEKAAEEGAVVRRGAASDLIAAFEKLTRMGDLNARLAEVEQQLSGAPAAPATSQKPRRPMATLLTLPPRSS